jgi:DNA polymerase I-like protein with 3'-5' exonuclease and polymerase domains
LAEAKEIQKIMETAVELKVPSPVDIALGPSWGNLKDA